MKNVGAFGAPAMEDQMNLSAQSFHLMRKMQDMAVTQVNLPNDFKFLVKNRHVDRDFDVVIKFKEPDSVKALEDLKGTNQQSLLLMSHTQVIKDHPKPAERLKLIQKIDLMKRVFDEFNSNDHQDDQQAQKQS